MDYDQIFKSYWSGYEFVSKLFPLVPSLLLGLLTATLLMSGLRIVTNAVLFAIFGGPVAKTLSMILEVATAAFFILKARSNPVGLVTGVAILGGMLEAALGRYFVR